MHRTSELTQIAQKTTEPVVHGHTDIDQHSTGQWCVVGHNELAYQTVSSSWHHCTEYLSSTHSALPSRLVSPTSRRSPAQHHAAPHPLLRMPYSCCYARTARGWPIGSAGKA